MLKLFKKIPALFGSVVRYIRENPFDRRYMRGFDWPIFLTVCALIAFGIISIYSATSIPVEEEINSVTEMMEYQPIATARLQLIWAIGGMAALFFMIYFDYGVFGRLSNIIYWANIFLLLFVLFTTRGRGNMAGWFSWGSGRTFQPSEIGKIAIIISLSKMFADRKEPIKTVRDLIPVMIYFMLPLILILAQPDVGTALVYVAIFAGLLFVSGTNWKLLAGMVCILVLMMVPLWYIMNATDSFRLERIMVFLNPESDPNGAGMNAINSRIAVGSAGLWGKGLFADGSFAALNYIPEDHTDFIFAITCETFGFVGAMVMVGLFAFLLIRMLILARRSRDMFGNYLIVGIMSMMLFHVVENIGMILGLLPITGIPLPFVSYGGSNMLTNMAGIGLVLNVAMRSKVQLRKRNEYKEAKL